jgi:hypothetical protein
MALPPGISPGALYIKAPREKANSKSWVRGHSVNLSSVVQLSDRSTDGLPTHDLLLS